MIVLHFNDKDDVRVNSLSTRRISSILSLSKYQHGGITGRGKVQYSRGYYNEFDFDGLADLKNKLMPCLETSLCAEFQKV